MASQNNCSMQRIHGKLAQAIEKKNYYEAHQLYRSIYFRLSKQQRYSELLDLLKEGANLMLSTDQIGSGVDLCNLYIDILNKMSFFEFEEVINTLVKMYILMKPESVERTNFLGNALKWAKQNSANAYTKLNGLIANILWKEKNYSQSCFHFLHSCDGEGCAVMLIEYHTTKGFATEVDLFIAQAVFHGRIAVFTVLCEQYECSICKDPTYKDYLAKIGQIFFGAPAPQIKPRGILDQLLQSLVSEMNSDASEMEDIETNGGENSKQYLCSEDVD